MAQKLNIGVIGTGRTELTLESLNGSIRLTRSMT